MLYDKIQNMSGHNKWSKIKHKKAATDAVKSKIYSKYNKLIQVAIKDAGGNIDSPAVQSVIERAKSENVPKDNIDRAIKKATGADAKALSEVMYEGFGPAGVGLLVKAVTDNTNRTVTEVKTALTKNGGTFASSGAVSWGFTRDDNGEWKANEGTEVELSDDDLIKLEKLISIIEEIDDVTDVWTNSNIK